MTSSPRFWMVGGIAASVLLLVLGWLLLISPRMQAVAETRQQAVDLQQQTDTTMAQVRKLQQQAQDLPAQIRALARIQRQIPSSVNVPALLRDIQRVAKRHDVEISTLTPGTITVFQAAEESNSQTSPSEPVASPDAATKPTPKQLPEDLGQGRLPDGVGLSYVPISITAGGEFNDVKLFTAEIEELRRAYLITSVQLSRGQADAEKPQSNPLDIALETRVFVASDRLRNLPARARDELGARNG